MGTEKRERQKANRAKKQADLAKAERTSAVKRNVVRWVLVVIAAFVAILVIAYIGGAFDSDDEPETPILTIPTSLPVSLPDSLPDSLPVDGTLPATDTPITTGG